VLNTWHNSHMGPNTLIEVSGRFLTFNLCGSRDYFCPYCTFEGKNIPKFFNILQYLIISNNGITNILNSKFRMDLLVC
jgi:hypothetical protein